MCIHSLDDLNDQTNYFRKNRGRAYVAGLSSYEKRGSKRIFSGGVIVDARNAEEVANNIKDLMFWHPGSTKIDLSDVNAVRKKFGLSELDQDGLPKATRPAQEELDKQLIRIDPGYAKLHEPLQSAKMAEFMIQKMDQALAA